MRKCTWAGRVLLLPPLLLGSMPAQAEWVEWLVEPSYTEYWSDNVSFTAFPAAELSERWRELGVSVGRVYQVADHSRLQLTAIAMGRQFDKFSTLDGEDLGVSAGLRHKYGVGPETWWSQAFAEYWQLRVDNTLRDGDRQNFGLRVGRRLSPRWDFSAELAWVERDGGLGLPRPVDPDRPTNVYDMSHQYLALNLSATISERLLSSVVYTYRDGEIDSQCPTANVGVVVASENPSALSRDPDGFGGCVYRIDGSGQALELQLNYAFTGHFGLQFSARQIRGEGRELNYEAQQIRLGVAYRF